MNSEPRTLNPEPLRGATKERRARTDLGLALLSLVAIPGEPLDTYDIAVWAGCSHQNITRIEQKALRKIRKILDPATFAELRLTLESFHSRQPASRRHTFFASP